MELIEIPKKIFDQFAEVEGGKKYKGIAREDGIWVGEFDLVDLEDLQCPNGDTCSIGYRYSEHDRHHVFAVWSSKPRGDRQSTNEPQPVLLIISGTQTSGTRNTEDRKNLKQFAKIQTGNHGLDLSHPMMEIVSLIIFTANEMALEAAPSR